MSNPFEASESVFMSVGKRKLNGNRLNKYRHDDDEIAEEIREHGSENVRIL